MRAECVEFSADNAEFVTITIYPICEFAVIVGGSLEYSRKVKEDEYISLIVNFVHVHVMGVTKKTKRE